MQPTAPSEWPESPTAESVLLSVALGRALQLSAGEVALVRGYLQRIEHIEHLLHALHGARRDTAGTRHPHEGPDDRWREQHAQPCASGAPDWKENS